MFTRFTLFLLFFSALIPSDSAYAHGQYHDYEELVYSGAHGDYFIEVFTIPLVNYLEVSIFFRGTTDRPFSPPQKILIHAIQENTKLNFQLAEEQNTDEGVKYVVLLRPQTVGIWDLIIDMTNERESSILSVPVEIIKINSIPWAVLVSAFVLIGTIAWLSGSVLRRKAKRD